MLATLWYPQLNPIGSGSIVPLVAVAVYAVFTAATRLRILKAVAPAIFAVIAMASPGCFFGGRRFPNADDIVGYYIWALAAGSFAWQIARSGSRRSLVYGSVVLFGMGWLLAFEVVARLLDLNAITRELKTEYIPIVSTVAWVALFVPLVLRSASPYRRARRIARGLCGVCGYDLRATPERCPECGTPIPPTLMRRPLW